MMQQDVRTIRQGSRQFPFTSAAIIASTPTTWYDLKSLFGYEADLWDYFDSLMVYNNSALPVHLYLNSPADDYLILGYSAQPVTRRAFRSFGLYNPDGAVDIAAGLITMQMRRLPPNVQPVVTTR
jgi:hypothetical protein